MGGNLGSNSRHSKENGNSDYSQQSSEEASKLENQPDASNIKPASIVNSYDSSDLQDDKNIADNIAPGDYIVSTYSDGSKEFSVYSGELDAENNVQFSPKNDTRGLEKVSVYSPFSREKRNEMLNASSELYSNKQQLKQLQRERNELANSSSGLSLSKRRDKKRRLDAIDETEDMLVDRNRILSKLTEY